MVQPAGRGGTTGVTTGGPQETTQDGSTIGDVAKGAGTGLVIGGKDIAVDVYEPPQGATRLKVTDKTQGRVSAKTGKPVGKPIVRIDAPHKGAPFAHINVENMPKALKGLEADAPRGLNHAKIPDVPTGVLKAAKHGGKALIVVGLAADTIDIAQSYRADQERGDGDYRETRHAVGRAAGGWGGAAAGAATGAAIGSIVPGLGTAIGGVVGGVIGGVGGSIGGSWLGERVARLWD